MASHPTPIIGVKPSVRDPLRNFKFRVTFLGHADSGISEELAKIGFISVSGMGYQTDMIPYREGGDNVITRKLPGQTDVGPLTLIGGVFMNDKSAQYEWFRQIFDIQWGKGNGGFDADFRCNVRVDVLKHPVTKWEAGGEGDPTSPKSAGMSTMFYNCWPGAIQWNDLNAGDNSVMISNMVLHHEGFTPLFGANAQNDNWSQA